ncbi:hypothetical protein NKG94_10995 [Micromonospora sp. M12]
MQIGNWGDVYAGFQTPNDEDPANWKFFSQFTREPFPEKAITIVREFMEKAPSPDSNFFTQAFGRGAQRQEPFGGAAFPHRDALFYSEPGAGWGTRGEPNSGDDITPIAQTWIAEFSQALRPYVDGAYVNVPNIGMAEWETAYWGATSPTAQDQGEVRPAQRLPVRAEHPARDALSWTTGGAGGTIRAAGRGHPPRARPLLCFNARNGYGADLLRRLKQSKGCAGDIGGRRGRAVRRWALGAAQPAQEYGTAVPDLPARIRLSSQGVGATPNSRPRSARNNSNRRTASLMLRSARCTAIRARVALSAAAPTAPPSTPPAPPRQTGPAR